MFYHIVSRNTIQGGITELNTAAVEAIAGAIEKALVGSQQEHGGIVAGGVSGLVVAQLMVEQLHPGFVMAVRPEIAGIVWEQDGQAVPKNAPAGNHSFDCTLVGNHPGFDSFCQKGADLMAAAQLCGIFGAVPAIHVFSGISKFTNVQWVADSPLVRETLNKSSAAQLLPI